MAIPVLAFVFESFLIFLIWGVMLVMNLWMFQKTKGRGNLLMLIGAGCLALSALLYSIATFADPGTAKFVMFWLPLIGAVLVVLGFYMTAKPVVDVHIEALKKKLSEATAEKKGEEKAEEQGEKKAEEKPDEGGDA